MVHGRAESTGRRHEVYSLAFLDWLLGDDPHDDGRWIAAAVLTHHTDIDEIVERYGRPLPQSDQLDNLIEGVASCGATCFDEAAAIFLQDILPGLTATGLVDSEWTPPSPPSAGAIAASAKDVIRKWITAAEYVDDDCLNDSPPESVRFGQFVRGLILLADHAASAHVDFRAHGAWKETGRVRRLVAPPPGKAFFPH